MAVAIRLNRTGRKGESKYRIIVKEKRTRRDGKPIEVLGWLEKTVSGSKKEINQKRYNYWLSQGAKPTQAVMNLLKQ
jgi:small subunit ribosomal protein S16